MPHIELDLDAKKLVLPMARALGVQDMQIGWGLMDMWAWCWAEKSKTVSAIHLLGFFGATNSDPAPVLIAFGFLAPIEGQPGIYRVRGAPKRLGLDKPPKESRVEAGRRGGLASAARRASKEQALSKQNPSKEQAKPKQTASTGQALLEKTKQTAKQTSSKEQPPSTPPPLHLFKDLAGADAPPPPDLAWKALSEDLFAAFRKERGVDPSPHPRDWKALRELRGRPGVTDTEIVVRWGRGLRAQFKARVDCFWDLNAKWDSLAVEEQRAGHRQGPLHRETTDEEFRQQVAGLERTADGQLVLP